MDKKLTVSFGYTTTVRIVINTYIREELSSAPNSDSHVHTLTHTHTGMYNLLRSTHGAAHSVDTHNTYARTRTRRFPGDAHARDVFASAIAIQTTDRPVRRLAAE